MNIKEYRVPNSSHEFSLSKLMGKKIADIQFYPTSEFGDVGVLLTRLVFEDGTNMHFEGEHDHPYLTNGTAELPMELMDAIDAAQE